VPCLVFFFFFLRKRRQSNSDVFDQTLRDRSQADSINFPPPAAGLELVVDGDGQSALKSERSDMQQVYSKGGVPDGNNVEIG
jgi:hypothetical protein